MQHKRIKKWLEMVPGGRCPLPCGAAGLCPVVRFVAPACPGLVVTAAVVGAVLSIGAVVAVAVMATVAVAARILLVVMTTGVGAAVIGVPAEGCTLGS